MSIIVNHTKQLLQRGGLALGMGLRQARTVDIGPIARTCGYDWLFIDMEHNSMDVDIAAQIAAAALPAGITPIVRVPGPQHFHATRLLDNGAQGIVVPHVDTAEQAAEVVSHCRFPPAGHRSVPGGLPQLSFASLSLADTIAAVNDATLVVVMLESPQAIENADAIAATPGIDVLLVGGSDLSAEMGIPGQLGHPRIGDAVSQVVSACRRHGKFAGLGGVYDHALMQRYIALGPQFILSGSDLAFLMAGARQRSEFLRTLPGGAEQAAE